MAAVIRRVRTEFRLQVELRQADLEIMMKKPLIKITLLVLLFLVASASAIADDFMTTQKGARYKDLKTGTGEIAEPGDVATIEFIGWLDDQGQKGREIYNSRREGRQVSFVIGTDRVMQGWNEGVTGMQQGGKRLVKLPASLGYGSKSVEDIIPPDARLIFVIELLELEKQE